jgi:uncharacterized protein YhdP
VVRFYYLNFGVIMSAKAKILSYLSKSDGYNTLTVNQTRARFNVQNVAARINELREEGHAIYLNTRIKSDGEKVSFYRLGTPTKRQVAAGLQALRTAGMSTFA